MDEPSRISFSAARAVASWRGLPEVEKRRLRRDVVLDRTISSMAMAGEPVSQAWIVQTRLQRAQQSGQASHGDSAEL